MTHERVSGVSSAVSVPLGDQAEEQADAATPRGLARGCLSDLARDRARDQAHNGGGDEAALDALEGLFDAHLDVERLGHCDGDGVVQLQRRRRRVKAVRAHQPRIVDPLEEPLRGENVRLVLLFGREARARTRLAGVDNRRADGQTLRLAVRRHAHLHDHEQLALLGVVFGQNGERFEQGLEALVLCARASGQPLDDAFESRDAALFVSVAVVAHRRLRVAVDLERKARQVAPERDEPALVRFFVREVLAVHEVSPRLDLRAAQVAADEVVDLVERIHEQLLVWRRAVDLRVV